MIKVGIGLTWYEWGLFGVSSLAFAGLYAIMLPTARTAQVAWSNLGQLTLGLSVFSVAFGLLVGWTITLQLHAMRRLSGVAQADIEKSGTAGLAAAAGAVVPSMLCCTPLIPSLLAILGVSTAGIYGLSGRLQSFFANHELAFLLGGLALLSVSAGWATMRVRSAVCLNGEGCCLTETPNEEANTSE